MIKGPVTHPLILRALAGAGHGSQVLLADGNYPFSTATAPGATLVYLNLTPDRLNVIEVLSALVELVSVEAAAVMQPDSGPEPEVYGEFRQKLQAVSLRPLTRRAFYDTCRGPDLTLGIACGDRRHYANLLLTIGAIPQPVTRL